MGNAFEITVVSNDENSANEHIDAAIDEIRRIEKLLTTFSDESQTNLINRNAGIKPVKVDWEIFDLIERSLESAELQTVISIFPTAESIKVSGISTVK
jgi:thiamine biosynthesis lipoprotein